MDALAQVMLLGPAKQVVLQFIPIKGGGDVELASLPLFSLLDVAHGGGEGGGPGAGRLRIWRLVQRVAGMEV